MGETSAEVASDSPSCLTNPISGIYLKRERGVSIKPRLRKGIGEMIDDL